MSVLKSSRTWLTACCRHRDSARRIRRVRPGRAEHEPVRITVPAYFYLDVGASESLGFQPTPDTPHGVPTDEGYANDLVAYEAARGIDLELTQVGCPGETTTTMLNGEDHCYGGDGTQLAAAMTFLSDHQDEQGIVTIDLGFNNVRRCLLRETDDEACVEKQLGNVRAELPLDREEPEERGGSERHVRRSRSLRPVPRLRDSVAALRSTSPTTVNA